MAAAKILTLIDKQDSFEIVRDQIASVLLVESLSQQQLANAAEKDARLWALRVFTEASNPWEQFRRAPDASRGEEVVDYTPIVNVWFDQDTTRRSASGQFDFKQVDAIYQVDCYGYGISQSDGDGQAAGDTGAAVEAHRTARLARNIIEASDWANLGLVGLVGDHWIATRQALQLPQGGQQSQHVQCLRLTLNVSFLEYMPQVTGQPFEGATITITRAPGGEIEIFEVNASTP